jgi:hypothetical protein
VPGLAIGFLKTNEVKITNGIMEWWKNGILGMKSG